MRTRPARTSSRSPLFAAFWRKINARVGKNVEAASARNFEMRISVATSGDHLLNRYSVPGTHRPRVVHLEHALTWPLTDVARASYIMHRSESTVGLCANSAEALPIAMSKRTVRISKFHSFIGELHCGPDSRLTCFMSSARVLAPGSARTLQSRGMPRQSGPVCGVLYPASNAPERNWDQARSPCAGAQLPLSAD